MQCWHVLPAECSPGGSSMRCWSLVLMVAASVIASLVLSAEGWTEGAEAHLRTPDPSGVLATVSTRGAVVDTSNPFFQSLWTNGRACVTCHVPDQAWSISPP